MGARRKDRSSSFPFVLAAAATLLPLREARAQDLPLWVEQGPGPALVGGLLVSGAIQALAASPSDPNVLFAGAPNGGIWRTTNAQSGSPAWTPLTDHAPSLSILNIVFSPAYAGNNVLFATFGGSSHSLPFAGPSANPLSGYLRSNDGGDTWTSMPTAAFGQDVLVRVQPTAQAGLLFAITRAPDYNPYLYGAVYRSTDDGVTWDRRSGSGGQSANGLPTATYVAIAVDPGDNSRIFVATDNPPRLFRSQDTGTSWQELTSQLGLPNTFNKVQLAMSRTADPVTHRNWVYFLVDAGPGIFYSKDSGFSWSHMDPPPNGQVWNNELAVSPLSPNFVFAAGGYPGHFVGNANASSGQQWFPIDGGSYGAPHTDGRDWVFSADATVMFESDDGGVFRVRNVFGPSPTWDSATGNLRVTEFLSVAYDSVNHTVFGACQDNSVPHQTVPNNLLWREQESDLRDGMQVGVDNTSIPGASVHYSNEQCNIPTKRRTYTSATASTVVDFPMMINGTGRPWNGIEGDLDPWTKCIGSVRWNQTFAVNAVDGRRLLFGSDYIYESLDAGDSFTSLGGLGSNSKGAIPLNPVGTVTAYAYGHPANVDAFYIGTNGSSGGHLLWVRPATGYPTPMDTYATAGGSIPRAIAIDPRDWHGAYVADDQGRVWHTSDAGATTSGWSNLTGPPGACASLSRFSSDIRTMTVLAGAAGAQPVIIVGGLGGVWATHDPDAGPAATWAPVGNNFPNTIVTDLHDDSRDDVLLAGTLGRGAWTLPSAGARLLPPLAGKATVTLDFAGRPGPACATPDDVPFTSNDIVFECGPAGCGARIIDDEYACYGLHVSGAGAIDAIGGGWNPDGTINTSGFNTLLVDMVVSDETTGTVSGIAPLTLRFDTPQTQITFDVLDFINVSGTSQPVTLLDAGGNPMGAPILLNPAMAIERGVNDTAQLADRFQLSSPTPFSGVRFDESLPDSGGFGIDNLTFSTASNTPASSCTVAESGAGLGCPGGVSNCVLSVSYSNVTSGGNTTVTTSSVGPSLPQGFRIAGVYYEIQTTATYAGPIEVCIHYTPQFNPIIGGSLPAQLLHYENGAWQVVPLTINDTVNHIVCGTVSSLSPFAVATFGETPLTYAGNRGCTATFPPPGSLIRGNLEVSAGVACTLSAVTISGGVKVGSGATLIARSTAIGGDLEARGAALVTLDPSCSVGGAVRASGCGSVGVSGSVGGNVEVRDTGGGGSNRICGARIGGNLQLQHNSAPFDVGGAADCAAGNTIAGNALVQQNGGTVTIADNTVGGNLVCQQNAAIVTSTAAPWCSDDDLTLQCQPHTQTIAGSNRVQHQSLGQCAP